MRGWRRINTWPIKGPLILAGAMLGFFGHALRWRALFAAAIAMVIPIVGFRDFWNASRFWVTVATLALAQVPLVMAVRTAITQQGFAFAFVFTIIDCSLVVLTISWACA
jgi:hypothetical protein